MEKTIFIDKVEKYDIGGSTTDLKKAEYIFALHGMNFEQILSQCPKSAKTPGGAFISGRFIILYNLSWSLDRVLVALINHKVDLAKYFDVFADSLSPQTVQAFHDLKEIIRQTDESELNDIRVSDNDDDFKIAYKNYIDFIKSVKRVY